jgi:hypothetical protein
MAWPEYFSNTQGEMSMKHVLTWLALSLFLASPSFAATEQDEAKARLINEYFSYIPMKKMMEDTTRELAKQVPADRRQLFIDAMTKNMRLEVLEQTARQSMAKHFTLPELEMYVEFIKRPEARSAMDKMKFYMADLMPVIQQELMRAFRATAAQAPK